MKTASDFQIEIINDQQVIPLDQEYLHALVIRVLQLLGWERAILNILIVDNEAIHEINSEFLQHDFPTDVITFPMHDEPLKASSQLPLEGEIVISAEMAKELAETVGWSEVDELSLYLIHALLHLCGYDDITEEDRTLMRKKEREILAANQITVSPGDTRWNNLQ